MIDNVKKFLCHMIFAGCVVLCAAISVGSAEGQSENGMISRVETGLLPPVLIEGRPAYTLEDRMAYYDIPGVSIAVIKDFQVEWVKHYGVRDAERGDPVTDSTLFNVGSLSKAVAAATALALVNDGLVELDTDINQYLKSWKVPESPLTEKSKVTLRRLLNHSGGIMSASPKLFTSDDVPTLVEILNGVPSLNIPPTTVVAEPGTTFIYSNAGYSIVQLLVEDMTGESYPDFARQRIFESLGMRYSTFEQPLPENKERYASARHRQDGTVYDPNRYIYPLLTAGGLWTTAEGYARFVIEIQKSVRGESNLIMSQELARQMISPQEAKEYGLGVFMRYTDDVTYFGHIGDSRGFIGGFASHPTDGYGAVVVVNRDAAIPFTREIIQSIAAAYDWQSFLPEIHTLVDLSPKVMDSYVGRYRVGFDRVCTISKRGNALYYGAAGLDSLRLYPIAEDTLIAEERLGQIVFVKDARGDVAASVPHFADDIGRLPAEETIAFKMSEGERTPLEMLLGGEADRAVAAYRELIKSDPDNSAVSENRFNGLGYQLLGQGKIDEAIAVFGLNIALHPESGNGYDSMGEALLAAGDKAGALKHYRKAYELDPGNGNAAQYIEKLKAELNSD